MVCTFFGHRDCYELDKKVVLGAIEDLIKEGITEFLVGNQGHFDAMVHNCLKSLQGQYPHVRYRVVLAYLPGEKGEYDDFSDTVFPEGMELVHPQFAIDRRNRYLIDMADICMCYVNQTWGGAYKFARLAQTRGLRILNLGSAKL